MPLIYLILAISFLCVAFFLFSNSLVLGVKRERNVTKENSCIHQEYYFLVGGLIFIFLFIGSKSFD